MACLLSIANDALLLAVTLYHSMCKFRKCVNILFKSLPIMFYFFENWIRCIPQVSFASGTDEGSFPSDTSDWMLLCW